MASILLLNVDLRDAQKDYPTFTKAFFIILFVSL